MLNAGAALAVYAAGDGDPLDRLREGVERAQEALDSGAAEARWTGGVDHSAALRLRTAQGFVASTRNSL